MSTPTPDLSATRVIFRTWPAMYGGGVIALLLDAPANPGHVMMFEHGGQHAEGSYAGVMHQTRPSTPEEYAPLYRELTSTPYEYTLIIRKRRSIQRFGQEWRKRYRRR